MRAQRGCSKHPGQMARAVSVPKRRAAVIPVSPWELARRDTVEMAHQHHSIMRRMYCCRVQCTTMSVQSSVHRKGQDRNTAT